MSKLEINLEKTQLVIIIIAVVIVISVLLLIGLPENNVDNSFIPSPSIEPTSKHCSASGIFCFEDSDLMWLVSEDGEAYVLQKIGTEIELILSSSNDTYFDQNADGHLSTTFLRKPARIYKKEYLNYIYYLTGANYGDNTHFATIMSNEELSNNELVSIIGSVEFSRRNYIVPSSL